MLGERRQLGQSAAQARAERAVLRLQRLEREHGADNVLLEVVPVEAFVVRRLVAPGMCRSARRRALEAISVFALLEASELLV
jgi:hypothetical protein